MLQLHDEAGTMPAVSTSATRAATGGVGAGVFVGAEAAASVDGARGAVTVEVVAEATAGAAVADVA
jgi:hypothetical protein